MKKFFVMENVLVAFSNVSCIYPLYVSFKQNDWITFGSVGFVSVASFVSHLFENHKHGMPGFGLSQNVSSMLNKFDMLGCTMVMLRFPYLFNKKYGNNYKILANNWELSLSAILCWLLLRISEYDKYNPKLKTMYITTHCIWHMGIFTIMGKFLSNLIY
jgi:hypothetical protein